MAEVLYILFGWLLGIFSPIIADRFRLRYERKKFTRAISAELADLKYRVAIVSFLLRQRLGKVDTEYLEWLKPVFSDHRGSEPDVEIRTFVDQLLSLDSSTLAATLVPMRAEEGIGLSLKTFSPSYFESNIDRIADLAEPLQIACHEFRNRLNVLNQEIPRVMKAHSRTFDSSLSKENHARVVLDIQNRHLVISTMCEDVVEKICDIQLHLGGS